MGILSLLNGQALCYGTVFLSAIDPCDPNPCLNGGSCLKSTVEGLPESPPSGTYPIHPEIGVLPGHPPVGTLPERPESGVLPGGPPAGTFPELPEGAVLPERPPSQTMPENPEIGTLPEHEEGIVLPIFPEGEQMPINPEAGTLPEESPGEVSPADVRRRRETRPADPGYETRPVEPEFGTVPGEPLPETRPRPELDHRPQRRYQCVCPPGYTGPKCGQSKYPMIQCSNGYVFSNTDNILKNPRNIVYIGLLPWNLLSCFLTVCLSLLCIN